MSKSKSNRLRIGELRRIHELIGECEELWDDPAGWQAHLAAGARDLLHAPLALFMVADDMRPGRPPTALGGASSSDPGISSGPGLGETLIDMNKHRGVAMLPDFDEAARRVQQSGGVTWRMKEFISEHDYLGSEAYRRWWARFQIRSYISSLRRQSDGSVSCLAVHRNGDDHKFDQRQRRRLSLLHEMLNQQVGARLCDHRHLSRDGLRPRYRQTLDRLLEGDSEKKQIARQLGLEQSTVHGYVKAIYSHFGVQSRGELLSYFVHRRPAPRRSTTAPGRHPA